MNVPNRYSAACAAALVGSGQSKDDPALDEEKKAHWRKQAIDWLEADLTAWTKIVESGSPQARVAITETLEHWKADTDLIGLRNAPRTGQASRRRTEGPPRPLGRSRCPIGQKWQC